MSASIPLFRVTMNSAAAIQAVSKVLSPKEDGSYYVGEGPVGQEFETKFQSLIGSKVTPLLTNSCTSALILALKTIGVGPGDKVISSPINCFGANTFVKLADGSTKKLSYIVNNKLETSVMSYNETTKKFEPKKIVNWIKQPSTGVRWFRLSLAGGKVQCVNSTRTVHGVWVTGDHKIYTNLGHVAVEDLGTDHKILTKWTKPNSKQQELINGVMLGDGYIQGRDKIIYRFGTSHTKAHEEYIDKQVNSLSGLKLTVMDRKAYGNTKEAKAYQTQSNPFWKEQRQKWYSKGTRAKIVPEDLELTPLTLACWYMDDGCFQDNLGTKSIQFCTECFDDNSFYRLFYKLVTLGFFPRVRVSHTGKGRLISLGNTNGCIDKFVAIVAPYILPCFRYKLPENAAPYDETLWDLGEAEAYYCSYEKTEGTPPKSARPNSVFCIEVEDNHNFIVSDMVVANCTAGSHAIIQTGAEIIWADVNPNTGLIDPISVARSVTPEVKAIMTVDWGGAACDYEALKKHELPVIQDAAHCLKLRSDPNQRGDYTAWSFGPIKHLCMGDGGALLVPDQSTLAWKEDSFVLFTLYERAKLLRWFGISREGSDSFRCAAKIDLPGGKFHANDIQASIGLANMKYAVQCVEKARENALYYTKIFRGIDGLVLPEVHPENSWWLYTLVLKENRDEFMKYMISKGVGCSMVHARNDFHPVFKNISSVNPLGLDGVDYFDSHQCSIPVGHWVTKEQREYIANLVLAYFGV